MTSLMMKQRVLIAAGLAVAAWGVADLAYALPESLADARSIEVSDGSGRISGSVNTGHETFSFEASEGDTVTIDVNVTDVLPGGEYEDDDSQLFLFNSDGVLVAENDDEDETTFQSMIRDFVIPADDTYYAVVTTWDNDPVLDENNVVTGWGDNGSSSINYELVVEGISAE